VAFSPDGTFQSKCSRVSSWSFVAGRMIASACFDKSVSAAVLAALGDRFESDLLNLCSASQVRLWNGSTGKFMAVFRGHVGAVYQLAWSADSRLLVSSSKDSTMKVSSPCALRTCAPGVATVFRSSSSPLRVVVSARRFGRSAPRSRSSSCRATRTRSMLWTGDLTAIAWPRAGRTGCSRFGETDAETIDCKCTLMNHDHSIDCAVMAGRDADGQSPHCTALPNRHEQPSQRVRSASTLGDTKMPIVSADRMLVA
jgi:WD40 repeat protein